MRICLFHPMYLSMAVYGACFFIHLPDTVEYTALHSLNTHKTYLLVWYIYITNLCSLTAGVTARDSPQKCGWCHLATTLHQEAT